MFKRCIMLVIGMSLVFTNVPNVHAANVVPGECLEYWKADWNWEDSVDVCDEVEASMYMKESKDAITSALYDTRAGKKIFIGYKSKGTPLYTVWCDNIRIDMAAYGIYDLINKEGYVPYTTIERVYNINPKYKYKTLKVGKAFMYKFDRDLKGYDVKSITYRSSNKEIATVNKSGRILVKSVGTCTITASISSNIGDTAEIKMIIKGKE